MEKKINKLVTHDGSFHTDDVFACAALCLLLEKRGENYEIFRTRNQSIIEQGDYVFDVGFVYNPEINKFDHHQKDGAGEREFGIRYSSFGLVWKKFGIELSGSEKAAKVIDKILVAPIDAYDNGFDLVENRYGISPYFIQHFFLSMRPTWIEKDSNGYEMFLKTVEIAKLILTREIIQTKDYIFAEEKIIPIYKKTKDKRIIILDNNYPYEYIINTFPEPVFVVYPKRNNLWGVRSVQDDPKTFKSRKDFPKTWGGMQAEELQKITGVPDAIFCHRGLFLATAKTKEGAIRLAEIALGI